MRRRPSPLTRFLPGAGTAVLSALVVITILLLVGAEVAFEIPLSSNGEWAIESINGRLRVSNWPAHRRWEARDRAYREERDRAYARYVERRAVDPAAEPPPVGDPPPRPLVRERASLPYLPAAVVTGTLALAMYLGRCAGQRLRRDRRATCRCVACGYNLRATPDRCPECGAAPR